MTDPDLTERIAAQYYESPYPDGAPCRLRWAEAHPDDRAHWRGVVATITGLLDADRARPWPRVGTAPDAFDREKAERIWADVPYGDGTLPGRRRRIGTIDPATLEQLDVRGAQAREAVEQ